MENLRILLYKLFSMARRRTVGWRGMTMMAMMVAIISACSSTKYIPDNQYLLQGVTITTDDKEFDADTLINLLMEEYSIDREVAEKDVAALLETWKQAEIIN